jgi:hypothetical protein
MSEQVGPFLVPTAEGRLALICDNKRVSLDDQTEELWWWHLCERMKRRAEDQRKKHG